ALCGGRRVLRFGPADRLPHREDRNRFWFDELGHAAAMVALRSVLQLEAFSGRHAAVHSSAAAHAAQRRPARGDDRWGGLGADGLATGRARALGRGPVRAGIALVPLEVALCRLRLSAAVS